MYILNHNQPSKIEATTFADLHMKEKDIEEILRKNVEFISAKRIEQIRALSLPSCIKCGWKTGQGPKALAGVPGRALRIFKRKRGGGNELSK